MRKNLVVKIMMSLTVLFAIASCGDDGGVSDLCSDGIQNQDETGVDCGGVCDACENVEPTPTLAYWVKFKSDGVWKISQAGLGSTCESTAGACYVNLDLKIYVDISGGPTHSKILDLPGTHQLYGDDDDIFDDWAYFQWQRESSTSLFDWLYDSAEVPSADQTGSMTITSSTFKGNYTLSGEQFAVYDIEGTFSGKVAKEDGVDEKQITEGSFKVYFVLEI
jgi:hypothetical protein